jgi:hypothetical protein
MKCILAFNGVGFQELMLFLLVIAICIGVFLALRALMLWYWKVDRIVDNQQSQIKLLQELLHAVNKSNKSEVI